MILPGSSTVGQSTLRLVFIRGFWCVKISHDGFRLVATNFLKFLHPIFSGGKKKMIPNLTTAGCLCFKWAGWRANPRPRGVQIFTSWNFEKEVDQIPAAPTKKEALFLVADPGWSYRSRCLSCCVYIYIYISI